MHLTDPVAKTESLTDTSVKSIKNWTLPFVAASLAFITSTSRLSAQVVDVTAAGSSGSINGALFFNTDQQPAGTGFIDSFLRVQNNGFEHGYNTDGGFPLDDKTPHNYQHSLLLSDLATFTLNGTAYYKFMLDSNQSGNSAHTFTLDRFQIYSSNDPSITSDTFTTDGSGLRTLPLGNLAYTMNNNDGTGAYVLTTANGSGRYDMYTYVPVSDFNHWTSMLLSTWPVETILSLTEGLKNGPLQPVLPRCRNRILSL